MELITRQSLANSALGRWQKVYGHYGPLTKEAEISRALLKLGNTPDPDVVDATIGNCSWTQTDECDECGAENEPYVIRIGQAPDYDSRTAWVCGECLRKALELANSGAVDSVRSGLLPEETKHI